MLEPPQNCLQLFRRLRCQCRESGCILLCAQPILERSLGSIWGGVNLGVSTRGWEVSIGGSTRVAAEDLDVMAPVNQMRSFNPAVPAHPVRPEPPAARDHARFRLSAARYTGCTDVCRNGRAMFAFQAAISTSAAAARITHYDSRFAARADPPIVTAEWAHGIDPLSVTVRPLPRRPRPKTFTIRAVIARIRRIPRDCMLPLARTASLQAQLR